MIRDARFGDIPQLVDLMNAAHKRSRVADIVGVDQQRLKAMLLNAIRAQGRVGEGGACVYVWDAGLGIQGLIVGLLGRYYHIGDKLVAQDLFFVAAEHAPAQAAVELLDAYTAWARSVPDVIEINLSVTDIVRATGPVERLFGQRGYVRCGAIFKRSAL